MCNEKGSFTAELFRDYLRYIASIKPAGEWAVIFCDFFFATHLSVENLKCMHVNKIKLTPRQVVWGNDIPAPNGYQHAGIVLPGCMTVRCHAMPVVQASSLRSSHVRLIKALLATKPPRSPLANAAYLLEELPRVTARSTRHASGYMIDGIEFQQRGLPHAHMAIRLACAPQEMNVRSTSGEVKEAP